MPSSPENLWVLIMAGGAGTRFWPLSRRARPKQLLPFADGRSLLAATFERVTPLAPPERVLVATAAEIAAAVAAELPSLPADNLLVEPIGRDTAACVGWAAWRLAARYPEAVMVVLPADHVIPDAEALRAALLRAAAAAEGLGGLVTLALQPSRPETGFGYLELGRASAVEGVFEVARFVEKPTVERAAEMLASGRFRWNSGMFVWRVDSIVAAIRRHVPELARGLDALAEEATRVGEADALARVYPGLPRTSIDFGVMEKASRVLAVPVDLVWSDVGSWPALAEVLPAEDGVVSMGDVLARECAGSVLIADGPLLAAVGVRDLVVVALRDAVLVLPRSEAQRVKEIVELLRQQGRGELL